MPDISDKFQERYLIHQKYKKGQLAGIYGKKYNKHNKNFKNFYQELIESRRSQRIFNSNKISNNKIDFIIKCLIESPSSCNRQAIKIKIIDKKSQKEMLDNLLVGGVNWCHKANKILLFFAEEKAYKENLFFMPYLDAGVQIMNGYLACAAINIGCCYINPNIREENKKIFQKKFGNRIFCGALAIGLYDKKSNTSPKISKKEYLIK